MDIRYGEDATYGDYCYLSQTVFTCNVSASEADAMIDAAKVRCASCDAEPAKITLCNDVTDTLQQAARGARLSRERAREGWPRTRA